MKSESEKATPDLSGMAKRRLLSARGDPFLFANWERAVFLHFYVAPDVLRSFVPPTLELDLHEGRGVVSVVALTMRHFRPAGRSLSGCLFYPISEQRFLNLRTYARWGDEPGALFLWGWLSRPLHVPLPSGCFGLPYAFASSTNRHEPANGSVSGVVSDRTRSGRLAYRAAVGPRADFSPCAPGSLAEFALERYTGFFRRGGEPRLFRAWHPPWQQTALEVKLEDLSLVHEKFPWFTQARLAGANFAPGFERVCLGRAHRFDELPAPTRTPHNRLSTFFKMP